MMEAGRELDALVAEKVMGWHKWEEALSHQAVEAEGSGDWDRHWTCKTCGRLMQCNEHSNIDAPAFSTDIAAAWLVVEKTKLFESYVLLSCGDKWLIEKPEQFGGSTNIAMANTVTLAICRAALAAKGIHA